MILYLLGLLPALLIVIHVMKTGQERYWIYIVLFLPMVGIIAYVIVVILPSLMNTRHGVEAEQKLRKMINPQKELKLAQNLYADAPTPKNRQDLALAFFNLGKYAEALKLYQECNSGIMQNEPDILLKIAQCHYFNNEPQACMDVLNDLRAKNPDYHSPDAHLFYAKSLVALGSSEALKEYETLIRYYPGFEAKVSYAEALLAFNQAEEAKTVLQELQAEAKRAPRHVRIINQEALKRGKTILSEMK
ncbi:tetratricopeptide repeat protein [Ignatzschineria sp. LJL83]